MGREKKGAECTGMHLVQEKPELTHDVIQITLGIKLAYKRVYSLYIWGVFHLPKR